MKRILVRLACLSLCLTLQAAPAPAQDTAARITASLIAITTADNNAARRDAIVAQLRTLGVEPVLEPFGEGRAAGTNVVVTLPGSGGKTIVVGAHLDRVGVGRGAVDNGGSCAVLIELIAALKASPLARSTLRVVFFDREENGLVGSRMHFSMPGHLADYAVNLDVFAYGDTIFATGSRPDGVLMRSLRAAGEATSLPIRDVPPARYPGSDHQTMINAQIETLGLALVDKADADGIVAMDVAKMTVGKGPRVLQIIHTPNDTMAEVRVDQMIRGIALVEQLVRKIDSAQ